jgi:hypothetical protein
MTATQLGELEFPRTAPRLLDAAATVETYDYRDRKTTVALYDARTAAPTSASAAVLAAAAARATRTRICADCGARCQRPLPTGGQDRPLCPACRQVARLREAQQDAAKGRAAAAVTAAGWLADWPDLAVVQVDLTVPPPTPSGRARPAAAARIWAVDARGSRLVDVTIRLRRSRSPVVPAAALDPGGAAPQVHGALLGRPLLMWSGDELGQLRTAVPHERWPGGRDVSDRHATMREVSARWRGELDWRTRGLLVPIAPGTPDRLMLHVLRVAAAGG